MRTSTTWGQLAPLHDTEFIPYDHEHNGNSGIDHASASVGRPLLSVTHSEDGNEHRYDYDHKDYPDDYEHEVRLFRGELNNARWPDSSAVSQNLLADSGLRGKEAGIGAGVGFNGTEETGDRRQAPGGVKNERHV